MKKFVSLCLVLSCMYIVQAQEVMVEEYYLQKLITEATILYCDVDTLMDGTLVKKIEYVFVDTTVFYGAFVTSAPFKNQAIECDFVYFDDGVFGLSLEDDDFYHLPYLKKFLNRKMVITPILPYKKEYAPWWYQE